MCFEILEYFTIKKKIQWNYFCFIGNKMLNIRLKVNIYSLVVWGKFLCEAIIKNQMTHPQTVMSLHFLRGPIPICLCQWGALLGSFVPLQWLPSD